MSSREYRDWKLYYDRYPFDDESIFVLPIAQLMSMVTNVFASGKTQPYDFMLAYQARKTADAPKNLDEKFKAAFARLKKSPA